MSSPATLRLLPQFRTDAHSTLATNKLVHSDISQGGAAVDTLFDGFVATDPAALADLENRGANERFLGSVQRFAERMGPAVSTTGMPTVSDLRGAFEIYLGEHPPMEAGEVALQGATLAADVFQPKSIDPERIFVSPRGVVAFKGADDAEGNTQLIPFRMPPWAVKDLFGQGKVAVSVAAGGKLNLGTGTLDAEKEFPGFLLKFVLQSQSHLILFEDEVDGARDVLKFSYLGQAYGIKKSTLAELYPEGVDVPDLDAEFKQLASAAFPLEGEQGIWNLIPMKRGGEITHDRWRIKHLGESNWRIFEDGDYVGDIDLAKYPMPKPEAVQFMQDVIEDPVLEATRWRALNQGVGHMIPLGSGSGFTPAHPTFSHMLTDFNGDVILVDPNTETIESLQRLGIPLSRVKHVVLTHNHYDHTSGFWKSVRNLPHKPTLHIHANAGDVEAIRDGRLGELTEDSTLTAFAKMALAETKGAITGSQLIGAFKVNPVRFQQDTQLGGYTVRYHQTNHPIPTIGYTIVNPENGKPVFLFTGDTRTDAVALRNASVEGSEGEQVPVMSRARQAFLANMVTNSLAAGAIVLADAGGSGIHPEVAEYQAIVSAFKAAGYSGPALEKIKLNLRLGHQGQGPVEEADLTYAGFGWADAVSFGDVLGRHAASASYWMDKLTRQAMLSVEVLNGLSAGELDQLNSLGTTRTFERGDKLMIQGAHADSMMLILDGAVDVTKRNDGDDDPVYSVRLTSGLVGEAVFNGKIRNADVTAKTNVKVMEFGPEAIEFLRQRGVDSLLLDLRTLRKVLDGDENRVDVLSDLDPGTRNAVILRGDTREVAPGETIIREGDTAKDLFVILEGEATVSASQGFLAANPVTVGRGTVLGEGTLLGAEKRSATVTAKGSVTYLHIPPEQAQRLLDANGGLRYYLLGLVQDRTRIGSSHSIQPVDDDQD